MIGHALGLFAKLSGALDEQLSQVNVEYASRRRSQRLGPVQLNPLPADFLTRRDQEEAERHRRGNEQFKHRYLYCRPGEDQDLPLCAPTDARR